MQHEKLGIKIECLRDSTLEEETLEVRELIYFSEKNTRATTMSRYIVCVFIVTILVREYSNFSANRYTTS